MWNLEVKKVLLKISWESLKWKKDFGFDNDNLEKLSEMIAEIKQTWVWIWIVVGGWNIYRGSNLIEAWVNPADSHNLSMLSTVFNWVVLKNFLEKKWLEVVVMDANNLHFVELYNKDRAKKFINEWKIVIFVWWTSNPYFSTDTAGVLRALELWCEFMVKATRVDWVYDSDPEKNKNAKFFEEISYDEIIKNNLRVMDLSAIDIAKNNNLTLKVVNLFKTWAMLRAVQWEKEGTLIN